MSRGLDADGMAVMAVADVLADAVAGIGAGVGAGLGAGVWAKTGTAVIAERNRTAAARRQDHMVRLLRKGNGR
jgi:hypothetical protein